MRIEISGTEAVRNFGDCLARIKRRGDTLVITKSNKPVAELRPIAAEPRGTVGDFLRIWSRDPDDAPFANDLERANSRELPARKATRPFQSEVRQLKEGDQPFHLPPRLRLINSRYHKLLQADDGQQNRLEFGDDLFFGNVSHNLKISLTGMSLPTLAVDLTTKHLMDFAIRSIIHGYTRRFCPRSSLPLQQARFYESHCCPAR